MTAVESKILILTGGPGTGKTTTTLGIITAFREAGAHERIVEMAMNGSGTRDTGRALHISKDTVAAVLKKTEKFVVPANEEFLSGHGSVDIEIHNALAAEMDEMRSFCGNKKHEIWLWRAVDHATNTPLAFVFGTRKHKYLKEP